MDCGRRIKEIERVMKICTRNGVREDTAYKSEESTEWRNDGSESDRKVQARGNGEEYKSDKDDKEREKCGGWGKNAHAVE